MCGPGDGPGGGGQGGGPGGGGPSAAFLDLEISQVLFGEAQQAARQVALELMREAMRERLGERLGEQLAALGKLAADELADDIEANLRIEAAIGERTRKSQELAAQVADAMKPTG